MIPGTSRIGTGASTGRSSRRATKTITTIKEIPMSTPGRNPPRNR